MFRLLLIGGTLLALSGLASAKDVALSPPARIDQLDAALVDGAIRRKLPLPPISRTNCENAGYASCRYTLGHAIEMEASGSSPERPIETIRARFSDPRDGKTFILLLELFMTRFDTLTIDRRSDLLNQAAADFESGKDQTKLEGEQSLVTLDRLNSGELWITVESR